MIGNKKWVPKILDAVRNRKSSDPVLMVVGAYHLLFGKDNVLNLLENEGFKITREIEDEKTMVLWGFNTHRRLKRLGIAAEFSEQDAGMAAAAKNDKLWTIALRGSY
jgi:ribonucleotide monophosphatase NagD (HAD superfamily)